MKRELHYFLMADLDAAPVTALGRNLVQPSCYIFMKRQLHIWMQHQPVVS